MTATSTPPAHTPTDSELLQRFGPIFERIAAASVRREAERELPYAAIEELRAAGFGAVRLPVEHGGLGIGIPQLFRLLVALGEADSNLVQILRAHFAFVEGRLVSDSAADRALWLPRIAAGSIFSAAMAERTEATRNTVTIRRTEDGQAWRVDGRKFYCTGTLYSDWIVASAMDGEDRVAVAIATGAPGVTRVDDWDGFGQRLTGSGTTVFENVPVADEQILRRFNLDEARADTYITAFYQLFHLGALAGIARAVLRDATAFVQAKTRVFGVPGTSSPRQDPLVQRVVGRLSSLAFAAESIVDGVAQACQRAYEAKLAGTVTPAHYDEADIKAFQGQQVAIDLVLQATGLLFEVGGASATAEHRRLDRHWRNARTLASHNPAILREQALGDYYLNGVVPGQAWAARWKEAGQQARDEARPDAPEASDASEAIAEAPAEALQHSPSP